MLAPAVISAVFPPHRPPLSYAPSSAKALAVAVRELIHLPHHEWWVGLLLDEDGSVLEWHGLYDGRLHEDACPCLAYADVQAFIEQAQACGAVEAVSLRYHRHALAGLTAGAPERFRAFREQLDGAGLHLADHLSLDATGMIYQFRNYRVGDDGGDGRRPRLGGGLASGAVCSTMAEILRAWS